MQVSMAVNMAKLPHQVHNSCSCELGWCGWRCVAALWDSSDKVLGTVLFPPNAVFPLCELLKEPMRWN